MSMSHFERLCIEALRKHYGASHAVLPQVPNGTSLQKTRTADALVIGLWMSRGLEIEGIEIKRTSSDLRKELNDPTKAEATAIYCHRFSILAAEGITTPEALPPTWGLLEIDPTGNLRRVRKSVKLQKSPRFDMAFICGLARAVEAQVYSPEELTERIAEAKREAFDRGAESGAHDARHARDSLAALRKAVAGFEQASGIHISEYDDGKALGEAVKLARYLLSNRNSILSPLRKKLDEIDRLLTQARNADQEAA